MLGVQLDGTRATQGMDVQAGRGKGEQGEWERECQWEGKRRTRAGKKVGRSRNGGLRNSTGCAQRIELAQLAPEQKEKEPPHNLENGTDRMEANISEHALPILWAGGPRKRA